MMSDNELAKLIHNDPEFNIKRWLNTRNKPNESFFAKTPNGRAVVNAKDYAGNVFYFNPHLNSHLKNKLGKNMEGKYCGLTYKQLVELDKKFPHGISYTKEGFPDFIKAGACMKDKNGKEIIVPMPNNCFNKNREKDFAYAREYVREKLKLNINEQGYYWHHLETKPARLVLVRWEFHELAKHTGGHALGI